MRNWKKGILSIFALSILVVLAACGGKESKDTEEDVDLDGQTPELSEQIQDVVHNIPSPSEIPFLLHNTGAEFNESLINPTKKVDQYAARNVTAALNLGVYATDIGYLSTYDKVQEALNYMSASKKLADQLGLSNSFDAKLLERFENNLSRKDSLAFLIDRTINDSERYLKDDNRNNLAALILAGSFIEGLYISTQLIETYPKDLLKEDDRNMILTPLIRVVLEQEKALGDLIKVVDALEARGMVAEMNEDLKLLKGLYEELNIMEKIRENRGDLVLNDETLLAITARIKEIRTRIVS